MARRHRHRHKRRTDQVQLNLAAMLDMAFQLLTFFILTFRPAPIEGQLALNLPPPIAQTQPVQTDQPRGGGEGNIEGLDTLHLFINSDEQGNAAQVKVEASVKTRGPMDEANVQRLDRELQQIFGIQMVPFDRVQIAVDPRLHYGELMKVIDVCTRQKKADGSQMQKISFVELNSAEGAP